MNETKEMLVDGFRQGAAKKNRDSKPGTWSKICRRNFFAEFLRIFAKLQNSFANSDVEPDVNANPDVEPDVNADPDMIKKNCSYLELKNSSTEYKKVWTKLKAHYQFWISDEKKESLQKFSLN